jgi:protein Mpv17
VGPSIIPRTRRHTSAANKRQGLSLVLDPLTSAIDTFFQSQPYVSAFVTCSLKAGTADFFAQSRPQLLNNGADNADADEECIIDNPLPAKESLDLARNAAFIVYGGIYQGLFQEYLYGTLFPIWFGDDGSLHTVVASVMVDQFFFAPVTCLPCAYIIKSFIMNDDELSLQTGQATVQRALDKYIEDVTRRGLLFKFWALWIPVQTLTFSVIPGQYRILFIACVSFFWMFILSAVSSETDEVNVEGDAEA